MLAHLNIIIILKITSILKRLSFCLKAVLRKTNQMQEAKRQHIRTGKGSSYLVGSRLLDNSSMCFQWLTLMAGFTGYYIRLFVIFLMLVISDSPSPFTCPFSPTVSLAGTLGRWTFHQRDAGKKQTWRLAQGQVSSALPAALTSSFPVTLSLS